MRLIFVSLGYHPDCVGGAYRYIADVAERLAARGHQVSVIYPAPEGLFSLKDVHHGVERYRFPNAIGMFFSNWNTENRHAKKLWEHVVSREIAPAITILCHAYFAPLLNVADKRAIFLFTGPWSEEYRFAQQARSRSAGRKALDVVVRRTMRITEGNALRQCHAIATISRYYEQELPHWHGKGLPRIEVLFGGVDLERFRPPEDRPAVRQKWKLAEESFLFVTVRRLDPRMGLDGLIRAFATLVEKYPQARLWLAGKGPAEEYLEELIYNLDIHDKVRLLGFVPEADLPSLYAAADCTLMPSLDLEGFGLATVESLACGTPVMGTRSGATPELLEPLDPTLIFQPGEETDITAHLRRALEEPGSLPARTACRAYAEERFDWEKPVSKLEAMLKEIS